MKKICALFLTLSMVLCIFTGCSREKPTAADSVKAIYDLYILRDTSGVTKLGMSKEEIENALNTYDNALAETIRSNFSASGLEIDNETVNDICQARIKALAKMNAEFTITDETDDFATVSLSTTYFDEVTLDTDAAYGARETADEMSFNDYDNYLHFIMETYTQNLISGYENLTPSEDKKEIVVNCIIIDNMWLPEDMAKFGNELGLTISGQK